MESRDRHMRPAPVVLAEGAARLTNPPPRSAFCRRRGVHSETEFKQHCRDKGTIMYHLHIGLNDWNSTRDALTDVVQALSAHGHTVERYGLCLDRGMSVLEADRDRVRKETGPRLSSGDWTEVAQAVPVQPHLGDFMIGTPAGLENVVLALRAGITTIGNLGQYFAFRTPNGSDEILTTETTLAALGAMAAARPAGALVHSYLDDGPAMQFTHYGSYIGWAALELYIVEHLVGARLAHCFGGLVPEPFTRVIINFALDDLRNRDSVGSMIYGNTVDYTDDHVHNHAVLSTYLLADIAAQLHRPTGHAINPVPLTEAQRIPSAAEIVEVHMLAREIEREARRSADLFHWSRLEEQGRDLATFGRAFASRTLDLLQEDGVDVYDAGQLLLALRSVDPIAHEQRVNLPIPPEIKRLEPWKVGQVRGYAAELAATKRDLSNVRIVLAVLEVHDVIRDALMAGLPRNGCEVIVLPADSTPDQIARAAVDEDATALVIGTYNGAALSLARELRSACDVVKYDGAMIFGGRLNEDLDGSLPVDVHADLRAIGVTCVDAVQDLPYILESIQVVS